MHVLRLKAMQPPHLPPFPALEQLEVQGNRCPGLEENIAFALRIRYGLLYLIVNFIRKHALGKHRLHFMSRYCFTTVINVTTGSKASLVVAYKC
jgi:hypothetical protein